MKTISKKSLIALLAVMMLIATSIGATMAYFSATSEASGATTVGLTKKTNIDEGDDDEKNINIENTGTAAIVVRVTFFGPDMLTVTGNENWVLGEDGWYYYRYVLNPGDQTGSPKLNAKLEELTEQQMAELGTTLQVSVVQEAEFAIYEGANVKIPTDWQVPEGFQFAEKQ